MSDMEDDDDGARKVITLKEIAFLLSRAQEEIRMSTSTAKLVALDFDFHSR